MTYREQLFAYVKERYGVEPDHPFPTAPQYPVLRHTDNRKWFALVMDVPRDRLGLSGQERVDVVNIKVDNAVFADLLMQREGFFKGYHQSGNWISILLDGTVPFAEICMAIDESFCATASKRRREQDRAPKEWLIPANPKYYDIEGAFELADEIDWKQGRGIKTGDTVYMYVAAPVSAILFCCKVTKTDIPCSFADASISIPALMRIRLIKNYPRDLFTLAALSESFGVYTVRGPRGVPHALSEALKR